MGNLLMCQMFRVKSHPIVVTFTTCLSGWEYCPKTPPHHPCAWNLADTQYIFA